MLPAVFVDRAGLCHFQGKQGVGMKIFVSIVPFSLVALTKRLSMKMLESGRRIPQQSMLKMLIRAWQY